MRKVSLYAALALASACGKSNPGPELVPEPIPAPTTTEVPTTTVVAETTTTTEPVIEVATEEVVEITTTVPYLPRRTTTTIEHVHPTPSYSSSTPPDYIKQCESGGDYSAVNPNGHYGAWQFSIPTWQSVGGSGNPAHASPAEQDYRASLLWDGGRGASHWECA